MAAACQPVDRKYVGEMLMGLPIVGPIARSGRWPADPHEPACSLNEFADRACDVRKKIERRLRTRGVGEHSKQMWDNSLQDVKDGFTKWDRSS